MPVTIHPEQHRTQRIGWLRAAVLGANDGIVSTANLLVGVAAAETTRANILIAGVAGLVAGAMSMAAGEYISVSSQSDTEKADIGRETRELAQMPERELAELQGIYVKRGLDPGLALQVAQQLTAHDALAAHARDELGIIEIHVARPTQAALASAATFTAGAAAPLLVAAIVPITRLIPFVAGSSLVVLGVLGALAAGAGGAPPIRGAEREMFWSTLAMSLTALVGKVFGANV